MINRVKIWYHYFIIYSKQEKKNNKDGQQLTDILCPWAFRKVVKGHVNCLEPLVDLLKDEAVQEKIDEVARLFYSNDTVTINLYWAAAAALLTLLREYPISYDCHY